MKKFLLSLLVLFTMFSAFSQAAEENVTSVPEDLDYASMSLEQLKPYIKTVNPGKLTIVTSPDFAPHEFYAVGEDGKPYLAGYDITLANYVADFLGLEAEFIPMDFDGTLMELNMGTTDIGVSGYSARPDRLSVMDFSDIYSYGEQVVIINKKNIDKFSSLDVMNNPSVKIGAQIGSTQLKLAKENTPNADILELTKLTDMIAEVINGSLDGVYCEKICAEAYVNSYKDDIVMGPEVPYTSPGAVIGVAKGNPALLAGVNLAIADVLAKNLLSGWQADAINLTENSQIIEGLIEK